MKRRNLGATIVTLIILLSTSGCARVTHDYGSVVADIGYPGTAAVAVAVQDQRPYVKSGNKQADYVGVIRGGFGNPFSLATKSGRPLAEDMAAATVASLKNKGFKAVAVTTSPEGTEKKLLAELRGSGADKLLLLTLNEWRTDTYQKVTLEYDVTLTVYDKNGKRLAEKKLDGKEYLHSDSTSNAFKVSTRESPRAFKRKLEELLNDPGVARAVR